MITLGRRKITIFAVLTSIVGTGFPSAAAATCESLASLALQDTTIKRAELVAAGEFQPPKNPWPDSSSRFDYRSLPAFCRVAAVASPAKDSNIEFEVWMPVSNWNGKFQGTGNGIFSGEIWYWALGTALARGYATGNTDTGHEGPLDDASFALGHPDKVIDFGFRAVHEMTVKSKAIVAAFYSSAPRHSYFYGCSSGGKQGIKEAQVFPQDYDGIVAGAPANFWTHLMIGVQSIWRATQKDSPAYIPPGKYSLIHNAVLQACDELDGIKDGVLEDPTRCHFDPKVLLCASNRDGPACLTKAQAISVAEIYAGPSNPQNGGRVYPGLEPGSELGWAFLAQFQNIATEHFRNLVFRDPGWDYGKFDFDAGVKLADKEDGGTINAIDPNLSSFVEHGGKLLLYHGWNDPALAPRQTIDYYRRILSAMGGAAKVERSVRLFMAPGMNHCGGGDGPSAFDAVGVMESWIEQGKAPDRITASHKFGGKIDRTRPLCPYPRMARYSGTGNTDDAASFVCVSGPSK